MRQTSDLPSQQPDLEKLRVRQPLLQFSREFVSRRGPCARQSVHMRCPRGCVLAQPAGSMQVGLVEI